MNILNYQNYNEKELREKSILDMMKDDYKTIKNFINEKRKYIFWIIVVFITMSFTDILSLGASWENICSQNPNFKLHKGGAETGNAGTETGNAGKADTGSKTSNAGNASNTGNASKFKSKKGDNAGTGAGVGAGAGGIGRAMGGLGAGAGAGGMGKAVGGFGAIIGSGFSLVQKAFMVFATILLIAGALSLPFLLIIIVTYKIIKTVCGHFMMY